MEKAQLERYLLYILEDNEKRFGVSCDSQDPNVRLLNLIKTVTVKTGKQAVVLIDEYDAPLLDVVHERESLDVLRRHHQVLAAEHFQRAEQHQEREHG